MLRLMMNEASRLQPTESQLDFLTIVNSLHTFREIIQIVKSNQL